MIDIEELCHRLYQGAILAEGRHMPKTASALIELVDVLADEASRARRSIGTTAVAMPQLA